MAENLVLLGINGRFYIFKPNGEIQQEVLIEEQEDQKLEIKDVSDNLQFFVFQNVEQVFHLEKEETAGTFFFKKHTNFSLIPQDKPVSPKTVIVEDSDAAPEQVKLDVQQTESEDARYITGSMQVGDDGSIWNLYFDKKNKKVVLRIDEEDKLKEMPEYLSTFAAANEYSNIQMVLLTDYLVIAPETELTEIFFLKVKQTNNSILSDTSKINLQMSKEWSFNKINYVNGVNRIQISLTNSTSDIFSVLTWDLKKNLEDRSIQIQGTQPISKGVNSNLNYINQEGVCYDLEFSFPLKFFDDPESSTSHELFEVLVSEGKDMLIHKSYDSVGISVTINEQERRYLSQFEENKEIL